MQNFNEFARFEKKFARAEGVFGDEFARAEKLSLHELSGKFARVPTGRPSHLTP